MKLCAVLLELEDSPRELELDVTLWAVLLDDELPKAAVLLELDWLDADDVELELLDWLLAVDAEDALLNELEDWLLAELALEALDTLDTELELDVSLCSVELDDDWLELLDEL